MAEKPLSGEERKGKIGGLAGWSEKEGRDAICKTFVFDDFKKAWAFMSKTAAVADDMDHHPEWFNVYNRVEVTLATHTASGVTDKDIILATAMNRFAAK